MDEEQQEDEPQRPATPLQQQQQPQHQQSTKSNELIQQHKLPNPLPPGMPPPPISSTSVVEPLDQIYTCPLCHETQATQKEFTTHIRGHNEVKPYNDPNDPSGQSKVYFCCLCGKMLSSFSSLDRHMLVHSGERPFSCDLCGQTFTTNGNMHRHKRTHGSRDSAAAAASGASVNSATPGSGLNLTDSGRSRVGRKRKQMNSDTGGESLKKISNGSSNSQEFKCPACTESFCSELNLDHHMYEVHPGQEVVCEQCSFTCPNYNYLKLHKTMFHFSSIGLTNTSTPSTSIISQLPTTPITTSATRPDSPVPLMIKPRIPSNIISAAAQAAAEAALKVPLDEKEEEEEEDLADVQSMLKLQSNTVQDIDKQHPDSDTETSVMEEKTLSSHEGICLVEDPIIRDMKLKGEFPCRLCPAVYPNLRALKGHNKEHLGKLQKAI